MSTRLRIAVFVRKFRESITATGIIALGCNPNIVTIDDSYRDVNKRTRRRLLHADARHVDRTSNEEKVVC